MLLRRLVSLPATLFLAVTAVFVLMRAIPGDPILSIVAASGLPAVQIDRFREQYGLDKPLPIQYLCYWRSLLTGDFGVSLAYGRAVGPLIVEQLPATVRLAFAAFTLSTSFGLTLGTAAAWRRGSALDALVQALSAISASIPPFWTALLAIYFFSVQLQLLPASGDGTWRHLVLPALVLAGASFGPTARLVRNSVLEIMGQEFVRVAWAKGLPTRLLLFRHVLQAAAAPIVTFFGLQAGFLLAGTAITESIFARPGLGRLLVEAVLAKDYPLTQGCVLVTALLYALANFCSDTLSAAMDPRMRAQ